MNRINSQNTLHFFSQSLYGTLLDVVIEYWCESTIITTDHIKLIFFSVKTKHPIVFLQQVTPGQYSLLLEQLFTMPPTSFTLQREVLSITTLAQSICCIHILAAALYLN